MKILIADTVHKILIDMLSDAGFHCDYYHSKSPEAIRNAISNYDGLIVRSKLSVDRTFLAAASKLKFIGRVGAGMDIIDTDAADEKGIICINSPEGSRDAVGEHTLGLLLDLFNNISRSNNQIKKGVWEREYNRGIEIKGKTVGILGYGNMGSSFAQRLQGFQCKVIAYDKYKKNYRDKYVTECNSEEFFEKTEVLSIHVPLTRETEFMINNKYIDQFKNNIYIINTARGKVADMDSLNKNMNKGKVLGCALDVLEYEGKLYERLYEDDELPCYVKELIEKDNVILSPHVAGWTIESYQKLSKVLAEKIINFFGPNSLQ